MVGNLSGLKNPVSVETTPAGEVRIFRRTAKKRLRKSKNKRRDRSLRQSLRASVRLAIITVRRRITSVAGWSEMFWLLLMMILCHSRKASVDLAIITARIITSIAPAWLEMLQLMMMAMMKRWPAMPVAPKESVAEAMLLEQVLIICVVGSETQ